MLVGKKVLYIHWKHFLDGFPICWPMDQTGPFEGTRNETEVTCPECIKFLEDE